jgi:glycosyltransferase 2 family protein
MSFFALGILLWQRAGLFRPLIWISRRFRVLTTVFYRHKDFLSSTDSLLREYVGGGRRFSLSSLGYLLGWTAGAVEAWVFLQILDLPSDLPSALFVQVWLVVVIRLTGFVPGNLGTHEAGVVMVFSLLGFTAESAMAFALLRRIRQIVWTALGLGVLTKVPGAQRFASP